MYVCINVDYLCSVTMLTVPLTVGRTDTADGDLIELKDLPSPLLYHTLDCLRERLRDHVKARHEHILDTLDTFGAEMTEVLSDMQHVS